jgi:hypothetical protein
VSVLHAKGAPRRETRKAAEGHVFVVLNFTGACTKQTSCEAEAQWGSKELQGLLKFAGPGVAIERTVGGVLRDGAGHESEKGHLIVLSKTKRQVAFEFDAEAAGLVWSLAGNEVDLAPFLPEPAK